MRRLTGRMFGLLLVVLLGLTLAATASAASPSFSAHGSAEQVYVTGLAPNARMSLLRPSGRTLYTQNADSLGGLLFRNVPPGNGYRVRLASNGAESGPITVHSDAAAPWDPSIYNQTIPDNGYTYLTTRDGTQLAIDVHPPTSLGGRAGTAVHRHVPPLLRSPALRDMPSLLSISEVPPSPTLIEYSGYGYADPARPGQWDSDAREPDGLRCRRRQHARNRVLGRRV